MKVDKIKLVWTALGMAILLVATPVMRGYVHGCSDLARRLGFGILAKEYAPGPKIEFRRLLAGHGQGSEGADFEIFRFRSSDCVEIDSFYLKFDSLEGPREELERRINSATRIVSPKSEIILDDGDRGERVVIFAEREYVILRRIGKRLHSIASPSLNHALEFEKRDRFEMEAGTSSKF